MPRVVTMGVVAALLSSAPSGGPHAALKALMGVTDTKPGAGVSEMMSAAFYGDTSCLLMIDRHPSVGRTLIDADVGEAGSRMLIHCDTEDGHRLTLLARGDRLERRERVALLPRTAIESGDDGIIAWLTYAGTTFSDDSAPRRYVDPGNVIIHHIPPVQAAGAAMNNDRQAFALVEGALEAPPITPARPSGSMPPGD